MLIGLDVQCVRWSRYAGRLTHPVITDPSTVARARNLYLVVNIDFASTGPFTVAGVPRNLDAGGSDKR